MMILRIYTRTGDEGETSLYDGSRVPKTDPRVECLGTLDELNSHLGLAGCFVKDSDTKGILLSLQKRLFRIETELATRDPDKAPKDIRVTDEHVAELERLIDQTLAKIDDVAAFIVPGTSPAAAHLHVARTVCRRAERRLLALAGKEPVSPIVLKYVNRLSDLLYALARANEARRIYVDFQDKT